MARNYPDWLTAYVDYASYSEAPRSMHFWSGVSAVAGALRRKTWIEMAYFKWFPNFFVVLVAPPGIVSKSSTANIAMSLLRKVPGINFGPDICTWPALVQAFSSATEMVDFNGEWTAMSAITIESSEFGNLISPQDREMVDLLITLWDGKQGAFKKITKMAGNDTIENAWINLIACTTPAWIAGNFPEHMIGGGFTSRCVFVYAEKKDKLVAYPHTKVPVDMAQTALQLVQDLEHIAVNLVGPFKITPDALEYGEAWYANHYNDPPENLYDDRFGGYIARKQTHLHKLAMIISASQSDSMQITADHLALGNTLLTSLEFDMPKVFAHIGKTPASNNIDRLVALVKKRGGIPLTEAYNTIHASFPGSRDAGDILAGAMQAGLLTMENTAKGMVIK